MPRYNLRAKWIGPHDEDNFIDNKTIYFLEKHPTTEHYYFLNNFNKRDLAHGKYFEILGKRPKKLLTD